MRNCYLTMPLDATRENLQWLETLPEKAAFDGAWRGLAFLDGLAAKYPEAIDYYLHDGKDRLEAAVADLTKLIALGDSVQESASGDGVLSPAEVQPGLAALHRELRLRGFVIDVFACMIVGWQASRSNKRSGRAKSTASTGSCTGSGARTDSRAATSG